MPLVSSGQSISGSISVVQGQQATYSLNVGGGCSGNYDDVSWSTGANVLECVSYAGSPDACAEINVQFDSPGQYTIVVSYSCEGGSGWAMLTVNVTPPPCPPGNPLPNFGNHHNDNVLPFVQVSNLSLCATYILKIYFLGGATITITITGVEYYERQFAVGSTMIEGVCISLQSAPSCP